MSEAQWVTNRGPWDVGLPSVRAMPHHDPFAPASPAAPPSPPAPAPTMPAPLRATQVGAVGLDEMTTAELRELAVSRGVDPSGRKGELRERLRAHRPSV